jgi:hypothetical protein
MLPHAHATNHGVFSCNQAPELPGKNNDTYKKAHQNNAILRTANRDEDDDHRPSITSHDQ